jgi:hypothetical protein
MITSIRVVVACLSAAAVGSPWHGDYIRHGAGPDGHSDNEVEAMLAAVLRDVAGLAFSADERAPRP